MPTKKQRRRREKDRRHEWEYVYVDDDGNEVEVGEERQRSRPETKQVRQQARPGTRAAAGGKGRARAGRKVDPPSWNRVLRRGAIFAPLMLVVIYLLKPKNASPAATIVQLAVLLVLFLPFSYLMDSMMYRAYRKRIGDPIPPRESGRRRKPDR
jgi:hypothetical protein